MKGCDFMHSTIWLVAAILFAVIEASTSQLVCIWFALGAVCAMIASMFTENILIQLLVFIITTAIFVAFTRRFVKKLTDAHKINTNADSLIGQSFVVTEEVDNDKGTGLLKASGTVWSVRNINEDVIPAGTKVIIEKIEGVKLFVKKAE